MSIKRWFYYRYARIAVRAHNYLETSNKKLSLDEIQKPVYDICIKLINDRSTELRYHRGEYQLENKSYFVSIRYNLSTPIISIVESREKCSNIHTIFMDNDYTELIISNFDREMVRRMKHRENLRKKEIADHLSRVVIEIESSKYIK